LIFQVDVNVIFQNKAKSDLKPEICVSLNNFQPTIRKRPKQGKTSRFLMLEVGQFAFRLPRMSSNDFLSMK
jgi:hypothetical protein